MRRTQALAVTLALMGCGPSPTQSTRVPPPAVVPPPALPISVSGRVADALDRHVAGATVEVMTGPLQGTAVISDENGEFAFATPLAISTEVRASKPGYRDAVRSVPWGPGNATRLGFSLASSVPTVDLRGEYDVTFTADAACGQLPEVARTRTYAASLSTSLFLSGATFGFFGDSTFPWNVIALQQFGNEARFYLSDPPVVEVLPNAPPADTDPGYLVISGEATGVVSREQSQVPLAGEFTYCPSAPFGSARCTSEVVTCRSEQHRMTLTRR